MKAEKQLVSLLSMPLGTRDAVTVLSLDQYPPLMSLLSRRTHKDMALKVVQTVLAQVRWQDVVCSEGIQSVCGTGNQRQMTSHQSFGLTGVGTTGLTALGWVPGCTTST
jgi:hypothetical protein